MPINSNRNLRKFITKKFPEISGDERYCHIEKDKLFKASCDFAEEYFKIAEEKHDDLRFGKRKNTQNFDLNETELTHKKNLKPMAQLLYYRLTGKSGFNFKYIGTDGEQKNRLVSADEVLGLDHENANLLFGSILRRCMDVMVETFVPVDKISTRIWKLNSPGNAIAPETSEQLMPRGPLSEQQSFPDR